MQKRKLGNSGLEVSAIGTRLYGNEFFLHSISGKKRYDCFNEQGC